MIVKRKIVALLSIVVLLCGCSKEMNEPWMSLTADDLELDVVLTPRSFENQIYTSYLYQIPFVTEYKGVNVENLLTKDLFCISLLCPKRGAELELKMHESELNEEVIEHYVSSGGKDTLWMQPRMIWKYDVLRKFDKTRNMAFRWTISSEGEEICSIERTFSCRSISQCVNALKIAPYERPEGLNVNSDGAVEIPEMFAGYVEEENAAIDEIMNHALTDCELPLGFNGYLSQSEDYLFQQMCAIWYVLQQHGIHYSNATYIPGIAEGVKVQNVRFFSQILAQSQANCVEGTCLLASIYQRFDLYPFLISIPGHIFLGIGNAEGELTYFLETTMIGNVNLDQYSTDEEKWTASKANFKEAMDVAKQEYEEAKPHLEAGDSYYSLINLDQVRRYIPSINYGNVQTNANGKIVLVK